MSTPLPDHEATPRTDAMCAEMNPVDVDSQAFDAINLCRTLERELTKMTAWKNNLQIDIMEMRASFAGERRMLHDQFALEQRRISVMNDSLLKRLAEAPAFNSPVMTISAGTLLPIECAPKDGKYILVAGDSGYRTTPLRFEACRYDAEYRPLQPWVNHANDSFTDGGNPPKYWMPLPIITAGTPT